MLKSTTVVTYELDDIKAGTDELARNTFEKLALGNSSFGLLLCDSDLDHSKFAGELSKKLGVPVVGFSSTAMFCGEEGLRDSVAILTTVTSDDTYFSIAASDPINPE
ncbi:MAG: hypothetical protein LBU26_02760, partial [Synergistaceae bacterium]|nr:hypothetical protein [Synergistaceae bacterium]